MLARSFLATLLVIVPVLFSSNAKGYDDTIRYTLEAQTTKGEPIAPNSAISAGEEFILVVKVSDLRPNPYGVFSAFVDIFYDKNMVEQIGGFDRSSSDFTAASRGMFDYKGRIFNVGGLGGLSFTNRVEHEVVRVKFRAISKVGHIRFRCDRPSDQVFKPTLLYGTNANTERCEHKYEGLSLRFADCDFNFDKKCNVHDLNQLLASGDISEGVSVNSKNFQFDLDGNSVIDNDDLLEWLAQAAAENNFDSPYNVGDANLDGVTDVSDYNIWNSNKFSFSSRWDNADFNGDGVIDVSDFNLWNSNKFQSSDFECSN